MIKNSAYWLAAIPVAFVCSCGSGDSSPPAGVGGNLAIGGGIGTGGLANSGGGAGVNTGGLGNTGGVQTTGGASAMGGDNSTGGASPTGGASATGGVISTGGTKASTGGASAGGANTGGSAATGGKAAGGSDGTGGKASGGAATGGKAAGGAATGGKASGGAATGGSTSTSGCQKGQIKSGEVVIMGESFYAAPGTYIEKRLEENAKTAGALATDYRNVAESGKPMSYIAGTEWTNATKSTVKVVIMDGGGIDCLTSGSCPTCASQFTTLLGKMATAGVQDVIYTRYPEPGAPPGSDANLKNCLDTFLPTMQPVCEGSTAPRCHWVDLRPVWVTGDTTDGLHPTQSGGEHVGDAIWEEMVEQCIAQ